MSEDNKIGLGPRIAGFLRERYSENRAKKIAGDFRVSVGTAKRWLRGTCPTAVIIEEMASRWNVAFVTVAFADYIAAADEDALKVVELMGSDALLPTKQEPTAVQPSAPVNPAIEERVRPSLGERFEREPLPPPGWLPVLRTLLRRIQPPPRPWYRNFW